MGNHPRSESSDRDEESTGPMPVAPPEVLAKRVIKKVRRPTAVQASTPDDATSTTGNESPRRPNPFAALAAAGSSGSASDLSKSNPFAALMASASSANEKTASTTEVTTAVNPNATFKFSFSASATSFAVGGTTALEASGAGASETVAPTNSSPAASWTAKDSDTPVLTGEEDENNLITCHVRVYLANKETKEWSDICRGEVHVNEMLPTTNVEKEKSEEAKDEQKKEEKSAEGDHRVPAFKHRILLRDERTKKVVLNFPLCHPVVTLGSLTDTKHFTITAATEDGTPRSYLIRSLQGTTSGEAFASLYEITKRCLEQNAEENKATTCT